MVLSRITEPTGSAGDKAPELVLMMKDGGVVAMGNSPFVVYYPMWSMLEHFTGAKVEEYDPECPNLTPEWDVPSTMLGPMG